MNPLLIVALTLIRALNSLKVAVAVSGSGGGGGGGSGGRALVEI